jgi:hypothetical protein
VLVPGCPAPDITAQGLTSGKAKAPPGGGALPALSALSGLAGNLVYQGQHFPQVILQGADTDGQVVRVMAAGLAQRLPGAIGYPRLQGGQGGRHGCSLCG